jgi:site-specific recombinase XerD
MSRGAGGEGVTVTDTIDVAQSRPSRKVVLAGGVPAIIADTHPDAAARFSEYFSAAIGNPNTRAAYRNAVVDFLQFEPVATMASLADVRPAHLSGYIDAVNACFSPQMVRQRLAALRGLFEYLARHGVLETNPAAAVRGPSYAVKRVRPRS